MFEYRPYQQQQISLALEYLPIYRHVCVQLPTGGGKTVEFSEIVHKYHVGYRKSSVIIVHRQELLKQAADKIRRVTGIEPSIIDADTKHFTHSRCYIAMVDSLKNRMHLLYNIGLVIIDECHIDSFKKVFDAFPNSWFLGFTATPLSVSKKDPIRNYYKKIILGPTIKELIDSGWLCQNITRCPKDIVDSTKLEMDNRQGDFNSAGMSMEFSKPRYVANVLKYYTEICNGQKTLIFNVDKVHSKKVTKMFQDFGYNCRHLDAESTDRPSCRPGFRNEREEILDWFKNTDDAILCNIMIATVGFDEPSIINIILNFSTVSLPKFIQTSGRGSRTFPGKQFFNIIDLGGNAVRFGDWSDTRDWEGIFWTEYKPGTGAAPMKTCPVCYGISYAAARVCNCLNAEGKICGHEYETRKPAKEQDLEELILLTKGIDVDYLIESTKHKHLYFPFLEIGHRVVLNMYEEHPEPSQATQDKAFIAYYDLCKDWYKKTLAGKDGFIPDITNSTFHIKKAMYNFKDLLVKLYPKKQN